MTTALQQASQSLSPGDAVQLFILDLTKLGVNEQWPFTNYSNNGEMVTFGGTQFVPIDIQLDGWENTAKGQFPRPKITIANTQDMMSGLLFQYNDGVGATLTRIKTFKQFLDGEVDADPEMYYPPEIYSIDQKLKHNKQVIQWQLASVMDQEGVTLPRRKMFRDTCMHQYRVLNEDGSWNYAVATCPYTGTAYYDENGNATTKANDKCGLRLSDCNLRFPGKTPLPTRAFPGLIRRTVA